MMAMNTLTDLFKAAFDCLLHDLLIAKLHAYGFDTFSLKLIHSYLTNRYQRVKINNSFSEYHLIKYSVLQGSILGPILLNIFLCDLFFSVDDIDISFYADNNTPYCTTKIKFFRNSEKPYLLGHFGHIFKNPALSHLSIRSIIHKFKEVSNNTPNFSKI